jgi:hypothetical protein
MSGTVIQPCLQSLDDRTRIRVPACLGSSNSRSSEPQVRSLWNRSKVGQGGYNSGSTTSRKRGLRRDFGRRLTPATRVGFQIIWRLDADAGPDADCPPRLLGLRSPWPGSEGSWMRCYVREPIWRSNSPTFTRSRVCARARATNRWRSGRLRSHSRAYNRPGRGKSRGCSRGLRGL